MSLKEYKERRRFNKTSEPVPEKLEIPNPVPVFVVQKHEVSHLHLDFRLAVDGVLIKKRRYLCLRSSMFTMQKIYLLMMKPFCNCCII